jgi:hypothetical protein
VIYLLYRVDGTPYYAGKGGEKRIKGHIAAAPRDKPGRHYDQMRGMRERGEPFRFKIIYEDLSINVFKVEKALIEKIGREPLGLSPAELKRATRLLNDHPGNYFGPVPDGHDYIKYRQHHWRLPALKRIRGSGRAAKAFHSAASAIFPHFAIWSPCGHSLWVDESTLHWLDAFMDEGEAYSHAILRLADMIAKKP